MAKRRDGYSIKWGSPDFLTREQRDLVLRRTSPFLDRMGMSLSLEHLMSEAYLQGLRDAVEIIAGRPSLPSQET